MGIYSLNSNEHNWRIHIWFIWEKKSIIFSKFHKWNNNFINPMDGSLINKLHNINGTFKYIYYSNNILSNIIRCFRKGISWKSCCFISFGSKRRGHIFFIISILIYCKNGSKICMAYSKLFLFHIISINTNNGLRAKRYGIILKYTKESQYI